ncbi:GTPase Era [Mycoplasmoides alvi]|uniref:GTPase Era n=1 Tax=Mycoplasmoides alvi TaxID=78580 RepID=UPI00051C7C82|nr:GTPase Era [Mycoplasmoides alvi]
MSTNNEISIIGCTNAGKSTLINRIFLKKVSIVSPMVQTTRNAIPNVFNNKLIIWDTPGILKPKTKLDYFLINEMFESIKRSKTNILVVDSSQKINPHIKEICNFLNKFNDKKNLIVYSKIDLIKNQNEFSELKKFFYNSLKEITDEFYLNLLYDDISILVNKIYEINSDSEDSIFIESIHDDWNDDLLITEFIREQIIKHTSQEIPHSSSVIIEQKKYDNIANIFHIHCAIIVEKESQKKIIIGKCGSKIKEIGICSRKSISNIYDCKINLKLFCKVRKNWRNDDYLLKSFGYKKWQK